MRVIAIEDEYLGLHSLTQTIQKTCPPGTEVKGFKNPSEALCYAREHPVDVAFLDMEIQQIHGLVMAKELQEIYVKGKRQGVLVVIQPNIYEAQKWLMRTVDGGNADAVPILTQINQAIEQMQGIVNSL